MSPLSEKDFIIELRVANIRRDVEWKKGQKVDILFRATELGGEVGELLNELKKLKREQLGWVGSRTDLQKIANELADVFICADLIGMDLGIDISEAVRTKFNATSEKVGLETRL